MSELKTIEIKLKEIFSVLYEIKYIANTREQSTLVFNLTSQVIN